MTPSEYMKNVLVTESTDLLPIKARIDDKMVRLLHGSLGLSSELAELVDAVYDVEKNNPIDWVNVAEESSDLAWYVAVIVNTLGFDHEDISSWESDEEMLKCAKHSVTFVQEALASAVWATGEYSDQLKKHLFYGRELNREKIGNTLRQLCMAISGLCVVSGTTIAEARQTNINKLRARYGEKFSEAAALNRDLDTERKILEEGIKNDPNPSN